MKVPGTFARKGDDVPGRPHRCSELLHIPGCADPRQPGTAHLEPVPVQLLEQLAAEVRETAQEQPAGRSTTGKRSSSSHQSNGQYDSRLTVEAWLRDRGRPYRIKAGEAPGGRTVYLITCPFDATHTGGDCCIMQAADGKMSAKCFHASCAGKGWQAFKDAIGAPGPEHYDPPLRGASNAAERTGYQVILDYFRTVYEPTFRRDDKLHSAALARKVSHSEACFAPGRELVELLGQASDCPKVVRDTETLINRQQIPKFFHTWAPSAWRDLIAGLPEEEAAAEIANSAADEFCRRVSACLFSHATFGEVHDPRKGETATQRRSLLDWCKLWAKSGTWKQVRSLLLWSKREANGPLQVALRVELFGQQGPRELADLTQYRFADLAELYGVGQRHKVCGQRVVVLSLSFLAELQVDPGQAEAASSCQEHDGRLDDEALARTYTRENSAQSSTEGSTP
jgi:hypothetical protein